MPAEFTTPDPVERTCATAGRLAEEPGWAVPEKNVSRANVDVVVRAMRRLNQTAMRRFSDADVEQVHEDLDPELELDWSNSDAPDGAGRYGLAEWRAVMQSRTEELEEQHFDVLEIVDAPSDNVIVVMRVRGRGRVSGAEAEATSVTVWTLVEGKVSRVKLYRTKSRSPRSRGAFGVDDVQEQNGDSVTRLPAEQRVSRAGAQASAPRR
jgi:ketosteroid isomerase-like protein